ncbi:MAG: universal stress protein, partial [Terriglobales bacterium]
MNDKILLPIDITHPHEEFFTLLDELIALPGTAVHLLYVREELPAMEHMLRTLADSPEELNAQIDGKARAVLEQIKAKLEARGAAVTTEIVGGPAAMMIESVARDEGFKFTAIAPGSQATVDKFLLGRISAKVVRHAPGTVLLLRGDPQTKLSHVVIGLDGSEHSKW